MCVYSKLLPNHKSLFLCFGLMQLRVSRHCPKLWYHAEGVHQTWTAGQNHAVVRAVLWLLQIRGDVHIRHCLRCICHVQSKSGPGCLLLEWAKLKCISKKLFPPILTALGLQCPECFANKTKPDRDHQLRSKPLNLAFLAFLLLTTNFPCFQDLLTRHKLLSAEFLEQHYDKVSPQKT